MKSDARVRARRHVRRTVCAVATMPRGDCRNHSRGCGATVSPTAVSESDPSTTATGTCPVVRG